MSETSVSYLRTRSFVERRERERQVQTGRERGGGEEFGLATKLWQKQTGCAILKGRFNYKWCFHSEPSRNPLFFRRSSSPNPQQGLVWPASEARRLTRVMHYEWCEGDTHVLILLRAVWTSTQEQNADFSKERSGIEAGLIELYCSGVMSCEKGVFMHFKLNFLHLYCIPLSSCLQTVPLLPSFLSSLQKVSLFLSKNSTGGGRQSQQTGLLCSLECCMDLSCITTNTLSLLLPSIFSSSSLWNPLQSTLSSSHPPPFSIEGE